jgi:hypothetical protein
MTPTLADWLRFADRIAAAREPGEFVVAPAGSTTEQMLLAVEGLRAAFTEAK